MCFLGYSKLYEPEDLYCVGGWWRERVRVCWVCVYVCVECLRVWDGLSVTAGVS